ncbi:MAG: acetamidase/formamidase family protein [Planctomycetes bacterium]|nr:acetamidase/formamidase family protein [Planctomycetota bacterium]
MPGDTIEVRIHRVIPAPWGWTYAGKGMGNAALNAAAGLNPDELTLINWEINADSTGRGTAHSSLGTSLPIRPFPGTIGLAPARAADETACAWTPRDCGGNMDCRELIAGSVLYLPVMVPGAFLSAGDGHAAQGDGEISGTAIETPLSALDLQVILRKDLRISSPRIYSGNAWITPAFAPTLDQAAYLAATRMIALISELEEWSLDEAAALASSSVQLRITQLVNPLVGVHAIWRH